MLFVACWCLVLLFVHGCGSLCAACCSLFVGCWLKYVVSLRVASCLLLVDVDCYLKFVVVRCHAPVRCLLLCCVVLVTVCLCCCLLAVVCCLLFWCVLLVDCCVVLFVVVLLVVD